MWGGALSARTSRSRILRPNLRALQGAPEREVTQDPLQGDRYHRRSFAGRQPAPRGIKPELGAPPPAWSDLAQTYNQTLVDDVRAVITRNVEQKLVTAQGLGIRHFLGWLAVGGGAKADSADDLLVGSLSGRGAPSVSRSSYLQMLIAALRRWLDHISAEKIFTPTTRFSYGHRAAEVLEWLGAMDDGRYPRFQEWMISIPHGRWKRGASTVRSLGSLDWPELIALRGVVREREALTLVRNEAVRIFVGYESVFRFGQAVLRNATAPSDVEPQAWTEIKTLLEAERRCQSETGRSLVPSPYHDPENIKRTFGGAFENRTWIAAGLHPSAGGDRWLRDDMDLATVGSLVRTCLGATKRTTTLVATIFCCDTGWNLQPLRDLPRHPFLFQTKDEYGLATSAFVSAFKNRARHDVFAYLERGAVISGLVEEQVKAEWERTADNLNRIGRGGGCLILPSYTQRAENSLLSVLERYQATTDAIRPYDRDKECAAKFFCYLTPTYGVSDRFTCIRQLEWDGVLGREGVQFRSIRKSYLALRARDAGSVTATRSLAGHTSTSVLMPHYLNTEDINRELDESIRFFQNSCQSVLLGGRPNIAVRLNLSRQDLEWFGRLAAISGISSAIGLHRHPSNDSKSVSLLRFEPTNDNLRDLFLVHRALRCSQASVGLHRWKVQALPLLAIVKAIGRTLCSKGLRPAYFKAARAAVAKLAAGTITLPPVMEG